LGFEGGFEGPFTGCASEGRLVESRKGGVENGEPGVKITRAYLPVGPFERQFKGGNPGGCLGRGPIKDPQKEVETFLRWDYLGKPLLITYRDAGWVERLHPGGWRGKENFSINHVTVEIPPSK
jgi:hypothetical protein